MKIIPSAYPECSDWSQWIAFTKGPGISRVFLFRLAAYVRDHIGSRASMYGFRTYAEQQAAYADYLAGGNLAAKPGTSWHEFGLAVDFNRIATVNGKGDYPGTIDEDYQRFASGQPEILNQYGLTHTVKGEPWHIQPIETKGYTGVRSVFLDSDDAMNGDDQMIFCKRGDGSLSAPNDNVKQFQSALSALNIPTDADGSYGGGTASSVKALETGYGLPVTEGNEVSDDHIRVMLWGLLEKLSQPSGVSDAAYDELSAQCDAVKAERDKLASAINQGAKLASDQAKLISDLRAGNKAVAAHIDALIRFSQQNII